MKTTVLLFLLSAAPALNGCSALLCDKNAMTGQCTQQVDKASEALTTGLATLPTRTQRYDWPAYLREGMTMNQVRLLLGEPTSARPFDVNTVTWFYAARDTMPGRLLYIRDGVLIAPPRP